MSENNTPPNNQSGPEQIATIDALTGLPNRAGLMDELRQESLFNGGNFALIFVDVDGLKHVNDTFGHDTGDEVIIETANLLVDGLRTKSPEEKDRKRPTDLVSRDVFRLGGDEFVALVKGVKTQEEVNAVIARLQEKLITEGSDGGIKASMGGRPHKIGERGEDLLSDGDRKMYTQKRARQAEEARIRIAQERHEHRQELMALSSRKFLAHVGGEFVKRASTKYSGVKDPR